VRLSVNLKRRNLFARNTPTVQWRRDQKEAREKGVRDMGLKSIYTLYSIFVTWAQTFSTGTGPAGIRGGKVCKHKRDCGKKARGEDSRKNSKFRQEGERRPQ